MYRKIAISVTVLATIINPFNFAVAGVTEPAPSGQTNIKISTESPLAAVAAEQKTPDFYQEFSATRDAQLKAQSQHIAAKLAEQGYNPACADKYLKAQILTGTPWPLIAAVHTVETGGKCYDTTVASYAGAQGPMQFIPSTWRAYGVDCDGDALAQIHDVDDAICGGANYLRASGAAHGDYRRALFSYNRADWYVNMVLARAYPLGLK